MYTHNLDPVLLDFGFLVIRWYSLAYIFGILIGWWLGKRIILKRFQNLHLEQDSGLLTLQEIFIGQILHPGMKEPTSP